MDELETAIAEAMKSEAAPVVDDVVTQPAPEAAPAVETPPEGETAEQRQARIDATGRAHDETGKFTTKPKTETAEAPATPVEDAPSGDKTEKPLAPPAHWSPEAKAAFVNAPRAVQQEALKREEEIAGKAKEWQSKAEDYNRLDKVIGPQRDRLAREGRSVDMAINQLFSFENAMQSNPVSGVTELLRVFARGNELQVIDQIARANGYVLTQATNQGQPTEGQAPVQADPTVRRLQEQVQQLTQTLTQQQTAAQQHAQNNMRAEIEAVAKDPKNLYYENLKDKIAAIVSIGDHKGDPRPIKERVQEAYDQACWADPKVRDLILADRQRQQQAAAQEAARQKAAAARQASVSITGSPGGPAPAAARPPGSTRSNSDYEADVRAAFEGSRA